MIINVPVSYVSDFKKSGRILFPMVSWTCRLLESQVYDDIWIMEFTAANVSYQRMNERYCERFNAGNDLHFLFRHIESSRIKFSRINHDAMPCDTTELDLRDYVIRDTYIRKILRNEYSDSNVLYNCEAIIRFDMINKNYASSCKYDAPNMDSMSI